MRSFIPVSALLILATTVLTATAASAADSPWVGTWKLDPAKSHFTGDTFTYSKTKSGLYHYSDGSTIHFDFAIDGKEYKSAYNHTTSWTAVGDRAWDTVVRAEGKVLFNVHREISADEKTYTITSTGTRPDGSSFKDVTVYKRVSGTKGLVGKWRSTQVDVSVPDVFVISSPAAGVLHWDNPHDKSAYEGKGDGSDNPISGPTVPPGLTLGYKAASPTRLTYVVKLNGKPDTYGVQTLAADGRSYSDVSWSPGKKDEKSTAVYVKQ
jgi:hypothetical protein